MQSFTPDFWHWFVLALVLGAIEMVLPGAAFLWLGLAAALVGLLLLLIPDLGVTGQLALFAVLSIAAIVATRLLPRPALEETDQPTLNRRALHYVGRTVTLESAIVNGRGRAFVGDTLWTVEGADLPAGASVRVIDADGTTLKVEPA